MRGITSTKGLKCIKTNIWFKHQRKCIKFPQMNDLRQEFSVFSGARRIRKSFFGGLFRLTPAHAEIPHA